MYEYIDGLLNADDPVLLFCHIIPESYMDILIIYLM
jgi:hypothetical protein